MLTCDLWSEIRAMAKLGKPIKAIARELRISKNTVRRALRQGKYAQYQRQKSQAGILDDFMPFLCERAGKVDYNATSLYHELQERGYKGCYSLVEGYVCNGVEDMARSGLGASPGARA